MLAEFGWDRRALRRCRPACWPGWTGGQGERSRRQIARNFAVGRARAGGARRTRWKRPGSGMDVASALEVLGTSST